MHYYKRNLGDYAKKAGRLTMLQHGAYTLLIDSCYDRETFPAIEQAIEWAWASTEAEIEAVKFVLSRFFVLGEDGRYVQDRIQEELDQFHKNSETNKRIAIERETKRKTDSTNRVQVVNEPPPNHKPITKNHIKKEPAALPDWLDGESWKAFIEMRKRIKKPMTDHAEKLMIGKLEKLKSAGHDVKALLDKSIVNSWLDVYEPKGGFQPKNAYDSLLGGL